MEMMTRIKIQESTRDVIAILDSAPVRWDLVNEVNIAQLTNRLPIAHLAIERGLKVLIAEAGETTDDIHGLNKLYQTLVECDKQSAEYLDRAFKDAVQFYRINPEVKGFRPFRALRAHLAKVGTATAFNELRYWAVGEPITSEVLRYILTPIYRELLCALGCIFLPGPRKTVMMSLADTSSGDPPVPMGTWGSIGPRSLVEPIKMWCAPNVSNVAALLA